MRTEFNMQETAQLITAIVHYKELVYSFSGLDPKQEKLREYWQEMLDKNKIKYVDQAFASLWEKMEIHIIEQMWSNTSCGWEGMGGAAMSQAYTTVIENRYTGIVCVYYSGRLAYIVKHDDKYKAFIKEKGYSNMPGMQSISRKDLTLIYKKQHN